MTMWYYGFQPQGGQRRSCAVPTITITITITISDAED
jgi:hypothetical protein